MNYNQTRAARLQRFKDIYGSVLAMIQSTDEYIIGEMTDNVAFVQACQSNKQTHFRLVTDLSEIDDLDIQCAECSRECYLMVIYVSADGLELVPGYSHA